MANRLAGETSPYLRQHADNPVDWYPWGPEALAAATERGVPILLSVGYAACHWCHVMAHECFEDDEVAETMNRLYVNVKVDREERPDIDAIYMDAVQAMTGRGGWPMTVFLTPAGHPFYGGTYFPKPQFLQLMHGITEIWQTRRADIDGNVTALAEAISRSGRAQPADALPGVDLLNAALGELSSAYDPEWGGFGQAPKFPSTMSLDMILRTWQVNHGDDAETIVTTSLDAMASGGIYDHIGGGFARYSVDRQWLVPHFEKMLYDQALLVRLYTHAWQVFGHQRWAQVVDEVIGYVLRDLCHPSGGFFCAEDADSPDEHGHGHEGLFHTWTADEVQAVLGADAEVALDWYEFADGPNFEGRHIPTRLRHRGELVRPAAVESARARLFAARCTRRRPLLDDKVLTEWNGLMLGALCEAAAVFGRDDWTAAAVRNGEFLLANLRRPDGRWHRSWHADGEPPARHDALAADHSAVVDAFTRLGELTGEARWTAAAVEVADVLLDHFFDPDDGGLFTTPDDGETLITRQKDLLDQATPSANSLGAHALYRLAALTGEQRYANHADRIMQIQARIIASAPPAAGLAMAAAHLRGSGVVEVVIPGGEADLLAVVRQEWRSNVVLAWGEPTGSPLWEGRVPGHAYVCEHGACQLPVTTAQDLAEQLR